MTALRRNSSLPFIKDIIQTCKRTLEPTTEDTTIAKAAIQDRSTPPFGQRHEVAKIPNTGYLLIRYRPLTRSCRNLFDNCSD